MFVVEGVNSGGGITMLWKENNSLSLLSYSRNHVDKMVHSLSHGPWWLIGVYGYPERGWRHAAWRLLESLKDI